MYDEDNYEQNCDNCHKIVDGSDCVGIQMGTQKTDIYTVILCDDCAMKIATGIIEFYGQLEGAKEFVVLVRDEDPVTKH